MIPVSTNFSLFKTLAVFAVVIAHFSQAVVHSSSRYLWIAAQLGLGIFAFSSGYFTSTKYGKGFSVKEFWMAKIPRLLGPLLIADVFLCILCLITNKTEVFHWHSIPACLGLSGVFLWFGVVRQTPLGNGLWFFTLLWFFYLLYPFLERVNRQKNLGLAWLVLSLGIAILLVHRAPFGVAFWETAWFFIFGTYCGQHLKHAACAPSVVLLLLCAIGIPITKYAWPISYALTPLLIGTGAGLVLLLTSLTFPTRLSAWLAPLSAVMLEVYVIHTYLFIHIEESLLLALLLSMVMVIAMALILAPAGKAMGQMLANRPMYNRKMNSRINRKDPSVS